MQPPAWLAGPVAVGRALFELAIPLAEDHLGQTVEFVRGCDVPDRAMQPHVVVMLDVRGDTPAGLLETGRGEGPNAFGLEAFVPAFQLAVGLRVIGLVRTCVIPVSRMKSLKSRAMNCGLLSLMMRGFWPGCFSRARCTMVSTSRSVMVSRISQCTM